MAVKASTGDLWLFRGNGIGGFDTGTAINTGWGIFDTVVSPGDFTSDGNPDIVARKPPTARCSGIAATAPAG